MWDNNVTELTWNEIKKIKEDICYIDIRNKIAYEHGHIGNAIHLNDLSEKSLQILPRNKLLVVYCSIGEKSRDVTKSLMQAGYKAVTMAGGYRAWLIENYTELTHMEIERYERQMLLPEVGADGQKKLKNASILIIGAGGLGSPAALYLAAAGIGRIGIADADKVNLSNLQRQILHSIDHLGMNKADSAKECMKRINDCIKIETYPYFITAQNIENMIETYDFIIDAADNFETKFLINDACVIAQKPFCHAGILKFEGQVMTYLPGQTACYRCIFEEIPKTDSIPNCSQAGIMGAVAGIVGCIQALEAIKYFLGVGELLTGKMLLINGLTMQFRIVDFRKKSPSCRVCGSEKDIFNVAGNALEYKIEECIF